MNNKEIVRFISHYEKITKWMFRELSKNANVVLSINAKQKIIKSRFN